jgi:hypothetical protein
MINVLTTNEDKFLLLSSAKIKVHFVSNINDFDRYFVSLWYLFRYPSVNCYDLLLEGTAYPSGAPEFTPGF